MPFEAVVFDFDGTLVSSTEVKRQTFFAVFPDSAAHRAVVAAALELDPEGSRHHLIPRMIDAMRADGLVLPPGCSARDRIEAYSEAVLTAVCECPEVAGASALLRGLHGRSAVYISSNTPEDALRRLCAERGWDRLVDGIFGFPRDKAATVAAVVARHGNSGDRIAVVGDGASDERAARANGCTFFSLRAPEDLAAIGRKLG